MACYRPMKGFIYGKTTNGKDNYIITDYQINHIEINGKGSIIRCYDQDGHRANEVIRAFREIPCGKCIGCRMSQAKQFTDRIFLELQNHKDNCFVTLTYDDDNLPLNIRVDKESGVIVDDEGVATLRKEHISEFIKALRNKLNYKGTEVITRGKNKGKKRPVYFKEGDPEFKKILFYASGEYGDRTRRPHAHLIIFGWSPLASDPDLKYVGKNDLDQSYYFSPFIDNIWKKGNNIVSDVSYETGAYVARYVQKKAYQKDNLFFEKNNIEPEFTLMSRRPAIGKTWFDTHKKCYATFSYQDFATEKGNKRIGKIRYFDKLMEKVDDDISDKDFFNYHKIKEERRYFQENQKEIKLRNTSLPYLEALKVEETALENRIKVLKRDKI